MGGGRKKESEEAAANRARPSVVTSAPATTQNVVASSTARPVDMATLLAAEGVVRSVDCSHKPAIVMTLGGGTRPLNFHAADFWGRGSYGRG